MHLIQFDKNSPTLGGGNCAFNAFAKVLHRKEFLEAIEAHFKDSNIDINVALREFLDGVQKGFLSLHKGQEINVMPNQRCTWEDFKNYFFDLRYVKDDQDAQRLLSPILRHLAVSKFDRSENSTDIEKTKFLLQTAFNYHFDKYVEKSKPDPIGDDIVYQFEFIKTKFRDICFSHRLSDDDKDKEILRGVYFNKVLDWWLNEQDSIRGLDIFLANMDTDGRYAGDLELAKLAEYFGITLKAERQLHNGKKMETLVHFNNGTIPRKSLGNEEQIKRLANRNIIDHVPNDQDPTFLPITEEKLEERMANFSNKSVNLMLQVLSSNSFKEKDGKWEIENIDALGLFGKESYDELIARGVISQSVDGINRLLVDKNDVMDILQSIEDKDIILKIYQDYYRAAPVMVLDNTAQHWTPVAAYTPIKKPLKKEAPAPKPLEPLDPLTPKLKQEDPLKDNLPPKADPIPNTPIPPKGDVQRHPEIEEAFAKLIQSLDEVQDTLKKIEHCLMQINAEQRATHSEEENWIDDDDNLPVPLKHNEKPSLSSRFYGLFKSKEEPEEEWSSLKTALLNKKL